MIHKIGIKDLVTFIYQSGDLVSSNNYQRANIGSILHRFIQASRPNEYKSEYYLKLEYPYKQITYLIDGRCDGIYLQSHIIEEIKSTSLPYDDIKDNNLMHFAQSYFYAYIYMLQNHLQSITIHLTYIQVSSKEVKTFEKVCDFHFIEQLFIDTLSLYHTWQTLSNNLNEASIKNLKQLKFPFSEYRDHQYQFASSVYKTILDEKDLFVQAPCGIGKTISTLFPALKAKGEKLVDKIFYVCAKNATLQVGVDTIFLLMQQNLPFQSVVIYAKDKMCALEKRNCDPNVCPYAKNYYAKNKKAIKELLENYHYYQKDIIVEIALKHEVCPFELSLDLSLFCDVILCDYNYVFDPRVYLKRYFSEVSNHIILVDEAHNLIERAKSMYSITLYAKQMEEVLPLCEKQVHTSLSKLYQELLDLRIEYPIYYASEKLFEQFIEYANVFVLECMSYFSSEHDDQYDEQIKELFFEVNNYLKLSQYFQKDFLNIIDSEDELKIEIYCINPRVPLKLVESKIKSTIFFSATLSPIQYYIDLLGGSDQSYLLNLPSPFKQEQLKMLIYDQVSTRYQDRQNTLSNVVEAIHAFTLGKDGNYMAFFPSYAYLQMAYELYQQLYPNDQIYIQKSNMDELDKQSFFDHFNTTDQKQLFFCVLGGMYAEGIDYKHDKLIGAIIVSVALAQRNPHLELSREYFNELDLDGYAYSYRYPAINKILQACGRVIRTKQDYGALLLIDDRYRQPTYLHLFPKHLSHYEFVSNPNEIYLKVSAFFQEQ